MLPPTVFFRERGMLETAMTPMIDVVFLLLVFFLWTASFQIAEDLLPSRLSRAAGTEAAPDLPPPPEADFDDIVVRVFFQNGAPIWSVNAAPLNSLGEVREKLATIAAIKRDAPVILHPDPAVPLGNVIDLYDISRQVGFEKVQFAVSEKR